MRNKYTTKEERAEIIEAFNESTESREAFAWSHGINIKTFNRWIAEAQKEELDTNMSLKFFEVKTSSTKDSNSFNQTITIRKSGMDIEIPVDLDENYMKSIFGIIAGL